MTSWLTSKHARPGLGGNLWGQRGWGDGKEHDYWACLLGKIISIVPCVIRDVILILGGEPVGFWGSCCSSFMRAGGLRPKTRAPGLAAQMASSLRGRLPELRALLGLRRRLFYTYVSNI